MRKFYSILIGTLAAFTLCAADMPSEPRMSLSERVANSTLVAVGKLAYPRASMGGRIITAPVKVEAVLFGSFPTNKTLFVSYKGTAWLIPEIVSRTDPPKRDSQWIFFLTDKDVKQRDGTNYFTRAVGPYMYAHDGLELAAEETLKQVRELIAEKTRPNKPDRANRRQSLGFPKRVGDARVTNLTAAVAHPGRYVLRCR